MRVMADTFIKTCLDVRIYAVKAAEKIIGVSLSSLLHVDSTTTTTTTGTAGDPTHPSQSVQPAGSPGQNQPANQLQTLPTHNSLYPPCCFALSRLLCHILVILFIMKNVFFLR